MSEFRSSEGADTVTSAAPLAAEALVAALFAVDPAGFGGVALCSGAGPARDQWLALLTALLPAETPVRRMPLHTDADRLLGGLDLAATLRAGRPIAQRGLLVEADGGILLLAMAERLDAAAAASVAAVIDTGEVDVQRPGLVARSASRIGVVALDEGIGDDEQVPGNLRERLAFWLTLSPSASMRPEPSSCFERCFERRDIGAARERLAAVCIDSATIESLCAAGLALGIDSVRAPMLACRAARAVAALDGRDAVNADDASLAAALVLAPRATRLPPASSAETPTGDEAASADQAEPAAAAEQARPPAAPSTAETSSGAADAGAETGGPNSADTGAETGSPDSPLTGAETGSTDSPVTPIDDLVLEAALAAIPPGLLAELALGRQPRQATTAGRVGAARSGGSRGRPVGVRRGLPQRGARLNLVETLRAAAPWQALRRRENEAAGRATSAARIQVRRDDFHVSRLRQRSETTTLFVVDASGSAALNRLAETKGAVELLLADCYVRRDSVAVIAFRGNQAELLLPPTRSLVRAKRSLAGLPGGGGTPLAAGIAAAHALADSVRRRGAAPLIVLLTDGRANIALDGTPGRARAGDEALAAARRLRGDGYTALLLDTSPQAHDAARQLASAMGARYLPLPHAGAAVLSQAVRAVAALPPAAVSSR